MEMYLSFAGTAFDHAASRLMSAKQIRSLQVRRFRRLFEYARVHSPFYRELYSQAGVSDLKIRCIEDIRRLPVVTKDMMRAAGVEKVLTMPKDHPTLVCDFTSGSSGVPFPVYCKKTVKYTSHLRMLLALMANGHRLHHRIAAIWRYNADIKLDVERDVLLGSSGRLRILRRYFIPGYASMDRIVNQLKGLQPNTLFSTMSMLDAVAGYASSLNLTLRIPLVVAGGETITAGHVEMLKAAFGGRVACIYGCYEAPTMAYTQGSDWYRVFSKLVFFEQGIPVRSGAGDEAEIILTNLMNYAMPFIRYRIGDVAVAGDIDDAQLAKRIGPIIGRTDDVLYLPGGRRFTHQQASLVMARALQCRIFRFVQRKDSSIVLQYSLWPAAEEDTFKEAAMNAWRQLYPDVPLIFEQADELAIAPAGKHRTLLK